ncbi:MAG TPA: L,D-transpeptidase family protein [Candidatus Limnocylindrales bacterium]|nr:L,D-transpeptidase family protein [Candidatus Limnocylindrales bacterium]
MRKRLMVFLAAGLGFTACSGGTASCDGPRNGMPEARTLGALNSLSPAGEKELHTVVESGRLADLQWPNFSDHGGPVREFYAQAGYKLAWSQAGKPTPQATELIGILEDADQKGLDSKDYDGARWPERLKALQNPAATVESALIKFDVALTVSAIRYGLDLHLGKVDPKVLHKDFDPDVHAHDPGAYLWKNVVGAQSVKEALAPIEPSYPRYQRTLVVLQKYTQMEKDEVPDPLPQVKKPIAAGQQYEAIGKLVRRLQFLGDTAPSVPAPENSLDYSGAVAEGVKHFQVRHGLDASGKLGPQTITELNRPMSDRVEQLRLMLERFRWMPHRFAQPPIIVNIPEFVLRAYDSSLHAELIMPVVVGRAMRTQTPVLEEEMKYLIIWPYWNVPPSILRAEIVPKITKDPEYLKKNNFEVTTFSGEVVTDGVVSEEVLAQLRTGKLMVRQKPGPKNALGLIKFAFPNAENIYLHSTPSQALFEEKRRDFSHGCIRVEDPRALAAWALRNNPGWTRERVDAAFQGQKQEQVNLTHEIPVLILYGTAIANEDGQVSFFEDIYGHDKALAKLFTEAYASRN